MKRLIPLAICGPLIAAGVLIGPNVASAQEGCPIGQYLQETGRGTRLDDVRCLQATLNGAGYNSGPVDGWFGPITAAAVVAYQTAAGITVDGEVGSETAGLLGLWSPEAAPARRSNSSGGGGGGGGGGGATERTGAGGDVWDQLAYCESGGNWAINTGNGYSGGLQFLHSSWRAYGGDGQAWQHSRAEQIAVAERILDDVGWGAWPACSRRLGLR